MASVFGSQTAPATGPKAEDPDMLFRRTAIYNLTERLQKDIAHHSKEVQAEMDSLFNTQAVLKQRAEQIDGGLRELQQEKEGLEEQLQVSRGYGYHAELNVSIRYCERLLTGRWWYEILWKIIRNLYNIVASCVPFVLFRSC